MWSEFLEERSCVPGTAGAKQVVATVVLAALAQPIRRRAVALLPSTSQASPENLAPGTAVRWMDNVRRGWKDVHLEVPRQLFTDESTTAHIAIG